MATLRMNKKTLEPNKFIRYYVIGLIAGFVVMALGLFFGVAVVSAIGFLSMAVSAIFVNYAVMDSTKSIRRKCGPIMGS